MHIYRVPKTEELETLRSIWRKFTTTSKELSSQVYEDILARYSEPHRAYHNVGHLVEVLEYFQDYEDRLQDPRSVALALFFHDVIYNVPGTDNEENSAQYAREALEKLGMDSETISRVVSLIRMTEDHKPTDKAFDSMFMLDMDIAILGAKPKQYQAYHKAIEAEFSPYYGTFEYYKGRLNFIKSFSEQSPFLTDEFKTRYSAQMFENLDEERTYLERQLTHNPGSPENGLQ